MKDIESNEIIDKKEVKVMKSLGNCVVMEHLAGYLNNQDLGSLNDTCVTVADSIDALSLWRKRAHKLSEIIGCSRGCKKGCNRGCNKTFDYKSEESAHYRELCYSLQKDVKDLAKMLRKRINRINRGAYINLKTITDAARLAHHGMLGCLKSIWLGNVDVASVPTEHLASLVSCVTEGVYIFNVSNSDLTSILDSSKSRMLYINNQSLSTKETQAVVQAMANVEEVYLGDRFGYHRIEVRLDISTLVTYGGRGKCQKVVFYYDTADKYREEVLRWAHRISWGVRIERGYPFDGIIIESTPEAPEAPWC